MKLRVRDCDTTSAANFSLFEILSRPLVLFALRHCRVSLCYRNFISLSEMCIKNVSDFTLVQFYYNNVSALIITTRSKLISELPGFLWVVLG